MQNHSDDNNKIITMTNEQAWDYAIGIVQLDGIKPSSDFLELVEKEKKER